MKLSRNCHSEQALARAWAFFSSWLFGASVQARDQFAEHVAPIQPALECEGNLWQQVEDNSPGKPERTASEWPASLDGQPIDQEHAEQFAIQLAFGPNLSMLPINRELAETFPTLKNEFNLPAATIELVSFGHR